jgi:hypothetical protein
VLFTKQYQSNGYAPHKAFAPFIYRGVLDSTLLTRHRLPPNNLLNVSQTRLANKLGNLKKKKKKKIISSRNIASGPTNRKHLAVYALPWKRITILLFDINYVKLVMYQHSE